MYDDRAVNQSIIVGIEYNSAEGDTEDPIHSLAAIACIWISLKTDDGMLRGFGLTFLGFNLYTHYFEFFWDNINKVVFFLLLAISLALVGRSAEKIWRVGEGHQSIFIWC